VCVLVYARTHTQTTWVLDVSTVVGQTPGEPEEPRSTEAQMMMIAFITFKSSLVPLFEGL